MLVKLASDIFFVRKYVVVSLAKIIILHIKYIVKIFIRKDEYQQIPFNFVPYYMQITY